MVSQETAAAIWSAYREIAAAEKLLTDLAEEQRRASLVDELECDASSRACQLAADPPAGTPSVVTHADDRIVQHGEAWDVIVPGVLAAYHQSAEDLARLVFDQARQLRAVNERCARLDSLADGLRAELRDVRDRLPDSRASGDV